MLRMKALHLLLAFLTCLATITVAHAPPPPPETVIYIAPEESSAGIGEEFAVDVRIADVTNLYGWDILISWQPGALLLECTDIVEGDFLKSHGPTGIKWEQLSPSLLLVECWCSFPWPYVGVSGSGTLVTFVFTVHYAGRTDLDILEYGTELRDPSGNKMDYTAVDGVFSTTQEANLVRRSAWPEHKHFSVSRDEDGLQTLSAKVKNLSPPGWNLDVLVEFDIVRDDGFAIRGETDLVTVAAGEIVTLTTDFGPLTASDRGSYYVTARCLYKSTGSPSEFPGTKMKTFSFLVVP